MGYAQKRITNKISKRTLKTTTCIIQITKTIKNSIFLKVPSEGPATTNYTI